MNKSNEMGSRGPEACRSDGVPRNQGSESPGLTSPLFQTFIVSLFSKPALQFLQLAGQRCQDAVTAERKRLARDIHDTLGHSLTGVIFQLEAAEQALSDQLPEKAVAYIKRARAMAGEGLGNTRCLVGAIHSHASEETNLCDTLRALIERMTLHTTLRTEFTSSGCNRTLPGEWEADLLNICREALTNTIRHARAGEFKTQLDFGSQKLRLCLHDNGRGFDLQKQGDGFGLRGMRERTEALGGHFSLQSVKGAGTSICVILPLTDGHGAKH
jgi:signal transduction histidine kinase